MLDEKNFTIVDLETTGGSPFFNRVIEVGLLRVEKGEVVEKYQTLVNPEMPLPEFITKITGLTDEDLIDAPVFSEIADSLLEKFEDAIFVAHNAQFDYGFLQEEYRRLGYNFNLPQLCTVRLSRALFPEYKHHNLTALIERYEFECESRHRAFDDAKVLWDFLTHLNTSMEKEELQKVLNKLVRTPGKRLLSLAKIRKLPVVEEPVYETEDGEILDL